MELDAARALRPHHRSFRRGLRGTTVDPYPERLLQNDVDDLVRARWKRPGQAGRTQKSAALAKRANNAAKCWMWQDSLLNFHGGPPTREPRTSFAGHLLRRHCNRSIARLGRESIARRNEVA